MTCARPWRRSKLPILNLQPRSDLHAQLEHSTATNYDRTLGTTGSCFKKSLKMVCPTVRAIGLRWQTRWLIRRRRLTQWILSRTFRITSRRFSKISPRCGKVLRTQKLNCPNGSSKRHGRTHHQCSTQLAKAAQWGKLARVPVKILRS